MAYKKTIEKSILSIDGIESAIIMASKTTVKSFIDKCGIPIGSYYSMIQGKPVKTEYINKIIQTLKNY